MLCTQRGIAIQIFYYPYLQMNQITAQPHNMFMVDVIEENMPRIAVFTKTINVC